MAKWLTGWRRLRLRPLLASTYSELADRYSVLPGHPVPLRAAGFGFTLARITSRPSRTRFAGRLNSGVRPHSRNPMTEEITYRCPCCDHLTLPYGGSFEICPVCFWQDDGQDDSSATEVWGGPNHDLSLAQARQNFQEFGASSKARLPFVRAPLPEEL